MASESIAHLASWAIDSEPIRARGIIVKYTLGTKGFSRMQQEFSVSAESRHIFGRTGNRARNVCGTQGTT